MTVQVVTIAERPDLAPVVGEWLWQAFWRKDGTELAAVVEWVMTPPAPPGPPQCFVALVDGVPCATASFTASDLDERPDLTPWLAGVFVRPEYRGQGLARQLVGLVEAACRDMGASPLWLYTTRAEGLYQKIGWTRVEVLPRVGKMDAIIMRRDF